jgi:ech hydrogenase subunit A
MDIQWMLAVAILLPLIAGILVFLIRHYQTRGLIVILTAVALIVNSIYFLKLGLPTEFTPTNEVWGTIITVLDYAILLFYIYAGLSLKNWLVLIFALTQIIPLAWWEFSAGASKALETITPAFMIDQLSVVMVLIISIIGSLICIYAIRYMKDHEDHKELARSRQSRFLFWLVMFLGAMNGLVLANNLLWLYFFWEVTTRSIYSTCHIFVKILYLLHFTFSGLLSMFIFSHRIFLVLLHLHLALPHPGKLVQALHSSALAPR